MKKLRFVPFVLPFLLATLVVAFLLALMAGNWSSAFLAFSAIVLIVLPFQIDKHLGIYFPEAFSLAIALFVYATLFLGEVGDFYYRFWWWDLLLHSGTGLAFGLIGLTILLVFLRRKRVNGSPIFLAFFSFSFALAIGALWEIVEFLLDFFLGLNTQKSGLMDTMTDLIIDTLGALIAAVIAYFYILPDYRAPLEDLIKDAVKGNT